MNNEIRNKRDSHAIKLMAKLTERNGFVFRCEPPIDAHIFTFFLICLNLFCSVVVFCFLIFQADTSSFLFQLIFENLITYFSHNYDNYSMFLAFLMADIKLAFKFLLGSCDKFDPN